MSQPYFLDNWRTILISALVLILVTSSESKPHNDDLLHFNSHIPRIHLHEEHGHHIRARNVLLGIFGTIAVFVGAFLVYRYYTSENRTIVLDGTFSERGALLPANMAIPEPSFRKRWPLNLFNRCGLAFPGFASFPRVPLPVVYYNNPAANPNYYDPWEKL